MKKQLEELLLKESYKNGLLDEDTVKKISDKLNRNMLKLYIGLLRKEEKKKMIFVTTPKLMSESDRNKIKALFPKKKLIEEIDPTMISGIKIIENDEAYDLDLNQTFHDIIRFVNND
jgi:F0F1-type ATP synthase delta subunit